MPRHAVLNPVADAVFAQPDQVQERVLLAVHADLNNVQHVAPGLSLHPQLVSEQALEGSHAVPQRAVQRLSVRVGEHQHRAGFDILRDDGDRVSVLEVGTWPLGGAMGAVDEATTISAWRPCCACRSRGRPAFSAVPTRRRADADLGEDYLDIAEKLRGIADEKGITMVQMAVAWLLRLPAGDLRPRRGQAPGPGARPPPRAEVVQKRPMRGGGLARADRPSTHLRLPRSSRGMR